MPVLWLLLHAIGSILILGSLFLICLLCIGIGDWLLQKLTHHHQVLEHAVDRFHIKWLPGVVVIIWYAGFASHRVQSASENATTGWIIAFHIAALLGIAVTCVIFDYLCRGVFDTHDSWKLTVVAGCLATALYAILFSSPYAAQYFGFSWSRTMSASQFFFGEMM